MDHIKHIAVAVADAVILHQDEEARELWPIVRQELLGTRHMTPDEFAKVEALLERLADEAVAGPLGVCVNLSRTPMI